MARLLLMMVPSLLGRCNGFIFSNRRIQIKANDDVRSRRTHPQHHHRLMLHTSLSSTSSIIGDGDDYAENPDLTGVFVDGFPLPPTPTRPDDAELQASLRRVPITSLDTPLPNRDLSHSDNQPLRVIIAGGGLGGLALASTLINEGYDVHVFEQAKQYKPFGGPIQIQSNALWALREIKPVLYEAVEEVGVRTGDRLSGIKDGKRYDEGWLVKFDAATPAKKCGLPLTLAINRVVLQDIFLKYGVPEERVHTSSKVVSYNNLASCGVEVILGDGEKIYGDVLIGADGIWSRVKHHMKHLDSDEAGPKFATKHARYSGYTCFTGTCKHTPDDIDAVAYKVFLGQVRAYGCMHLMCFSLNDIRHLAQTRHSFLSSMCISKGTILGLYRLWIWLATLVGIPSRSTWRW